MVNKVVTHNSLATLLLLEKSFEPVAEPFRCQERLKITIPFSEYVSFCSYDLGTMNFLATPTKELQRMCREYKSQNNSKAEMDLFCAFLKDVSFAVCKELWYAEAQGKGASVIRHSFTDDRLILTDEQVDLFYSKGVTTVLPAMRERLLLKGYSLPSRISDRNFHNWKYAVVSFYLSTLGLFTWQYNK